ncbi:MAG: hypothetical protein QOE86_1240 [Solirubrobacteraceae bacterium]|nr:hypothetical protein [Solirubrobacteraceae bacterium]
MALDGGWARGEGSESYQPDRLIQRARLAERGPAAPGAAHGLGRSCVVAVMKLSVPPVRRPSPATVIASLALFVAVGGPAEAARLINGSTIKPNTITSKQVKDRTLAVRDLSAAARRSLQRTPARSVGAAQLLQGSVGAAQLTPGSVTAAAMAPNSVGSANIIDKQVGNADLADSAVTASKLASGSVRKSEIAASAVGTSELANGAVTTDKLADGAITTSKLAANAVTGAQIADGSLTAADLADASGTVSATFPPLAAGACQTQTVPAPNLRAGGTVDNDVLLVTPPSTWNEGLTVTAKPAGTQISLMVCKIDAGPTVTITGATFRILAIDA